MFPQRIYFFLICAVLFCGVCSCSNASANTTPAKIYGADTDYYLGMRALADGKKPEARKYFAKATKKGSDIAARKSMEQLALLGDIQERIESSEALAQKFPTDTSFLIAAREYAQNDEFSRLLLMTDKIDLATCDNELAKLRLVAMSKKNDSRFLESAKIWFLARQISAEHAEFFDEFFTQNQDVSPLSEESSSTAEPISENSASPSVSSIDEISKKELAEIFGFRVFVFKRNYHAAFASHKNVLDLAEGGKIDLSELLLSDIGRSFLFSGNTSTANARIFSGLASDFEKKGDHGKAFYANFYAARILEKDNKISSAKNYFEKAMASAQKIGDGEKYDNALWYLLSGILSASPDEVVPAVKTYCKEWHDAEYFDDFFNSLFLHLFSNGKWKDLFDVLQAVDGYATRETVGHFAYVGARLLQSALVSSDNSPFTANELFEKALHSDSLYYAVLSAVQLGFSNERIIEVISAPKKKYKKVQKSESKSHEQKNYTKENVLAIEKFLRGYMIFGLPEYLYAEWKSFFDDGVTMSFETEIALAQFLQKCGDGDSKYFPQSLRMATRSVQSKNETEKIPREMLSLLYPKDYEALVKKNCEAYNLPLEIMFALIRTESFFESGVKSSAGAVGLTQLMDFTAADIAKRMRRDSYDATNPEDSVLFGSYYLSNLIGRLDESLLLSLFSYNAGITRVRRWLAAATPEIKKNFTVNCDLFLETVPFAETRGYGRSIIGAAVVYGIIHYNKNAADLVKEFLR